MIVDYNHSIGCNVYNLNMDITNGAHVRLDNTWSSRVPFRSSFSRIYFVLDGKGEITVNGKKTDLTQGNIYVIPYGSLFSFSCDNSLEKIYFHVSVSCSVFTDLFAAVNECITFSGRKNTISEISELYKRSDLSDILKIRSIIYSLLFEISLSMPQPKTISPFISEILDYAAAHYLEHPTEEQIAHALFVSTDKIRKSFRREMNVPLGKYIDSLILASAEKELRTTRHSIKEISQSHGYCDQFYFSRVFTQKYGISPQKYRKAADML